MPEHPAQSSDIEQILPAGFKVAKWLGVGNFGKVCHAKGQGGFECAFKIIEMTRGKAVGIKEFRALRVIRRIKPHRNLIEYLGVWLITSEGEVLDNADQIEDDDIQKLDVAELIIQMPLAVKSLEVRLKECRREFKNRTDRQPGDLPGIPLPELLPHMRGVAEALDHLHSPIHPLTDKGLGWIMHRDIKPANILIDRTGNVLVADYGVARAVGANVKSTQSGAGTPIYSAPEQITDRVDVVDPASDQYSLAITYYELRTGMLPFKDDVMGDVNSLKLAHTLGKLDFALLPRNEVNVLKRATHRTVNQRYPSCVEFIDELWKANGVTPMHSGFIQRPVPRIPQTDSSPDFGPTPPAQATPAKESGEKTGSRTPFELGTVTDLKPAIRPPEEPPPPPVQKGSGTLLLGDLIRSTPFQTAPFPPPTSDENLPIAPPIDDEPSAAPWEHPTAKPKSKSSIDINVAPDGGTATWHGGGESRKKKSPLLLIGGGIALAAVIAGGIVVAMNGKTDPAPTAPDVAKNDKTEPPKKDPDDKGTKGTENNGGPKKIDNGGPEKKIVPIPPDEVPAKFALALSHLAKVGPGVIAEIDAALPLLKGIDANHAEYGKPAKTLATQWSAVRDLLGKAKLTLDEAQIVSEWMPPSGIAKYESDLRRVYERLKLAHPTAGLRLQHARALVRGDSPFASVLGLPACIRGFPAVGVDRLGELVGLNPADAAIGKPANALLEAWTAALNFDLTFTAIATRDVMLKDVTAARDTMRKVGGDSALEPEDRVSLRDFYRVRLARLVQRFALKPVGLTTAKEWSNVAVQLPKSDELDSPWLELFLAESAFLANALETPLGKAEVPMPAALRAEPPVLRAYRELLKAELDWQNAKTPQQRRDAAQPLLDALSAAGPLLDVESRKIAAGAVLASTAGRDFKLPLDSADAPFADGKNLDLAKKCLIQAIALLAGSNEHAAVHLQARRDLLRAAAFPKVDAAAAKAAAITAKDIDAPGVAERNALWLAFARTRNLGTPGGVADAIAGYEKLSQAALKDIDTDLAPLVKITGSLKEFLAAVPEDQQAAAAAKLFLPLVKELFPRRANLRDAEKKLLADLAATAWKIAKTDDLELLHSFVRLEVNAEKLKESDATALHNRAGTTRTRALLGLVQLRNAKDETTPAAKIALIELGTVNVEKALELLKKEDPDKIVDLLGREALLGHLELGRTYEAAGRKSPESDANKKAVASFDKVVMLARDRMDFTAELRPVLLSLGRLHWELSNAKDWKQRLADSRTALESIKPADPEYAEARYWLALVQMYEGSLIRHDGTANFDAEKAKFLTQRLTGKAELEKVEELLAKSPADRSPFGLELLEWRVCTACARANASNEMNDADRIALRDKALKELDELAKADPLCGAVRRVQFLCHRAETAASRNGDKELNHPDVKSVWDSVSSTLAALQKHTATTRLPGSPDKNRRLFDAFGTLAKVHALAVSEQKKAPSVRNVKATLAALQELKLPAADVVPLLEDIGLKAAISANQHRTAGNAEFETASASVALQTFDLVNRVDPSLAVAFEKTNLLTAGSWRNFVAILNERAIKIDPDALKDNPDTVDLLIQIDGVLDQAERMLNRHTNRTESEKPLKDAEKSRNDLKKAWFDKGLDAAIDAAEKGGNAARSKAWREFKTKRYGK